MSIPGDDEELVEENTTPQSAAERKRQITAACLIVTLGVRVYCGSQCSGDCTSPDAKTGFAKAFFRLLHTLGHCQVC